MDVENLSVEDLALALSSSRVGVWKWLLREDVVIWSPETYELFRLDPKDVDGKLTFEAYKARIHHDDVANLVATVEHALATCSDYRVEHRLNFDGEVRWIRGHGRVLSDEAGNVYCVTGTVQDITEEHERIEELAEAGRRSRLYSDLATDYIYTIDLLSPTATPEIIGGSFERTTGYAPEEIVSVGGWSVLMHPDDQERVASVMAELRKGFPVVNEYRIRTKSGDYRWLRDRLRPVLSPEGELIALNGGVQDITERKSLLDQLSHAQKMKALAHLAGSVAHDFNNLLTVMCGASGIVRRQAAGTLDLSALDALDAATQRAADLTSSLLTFSRRQVAIRHAKGVQQLLQDAMPILTRAIGERVSISLVGGAENVYVVADSSQLELALLNLVVNARDAMPDGGTITITAGEESWGELNLDKPAELAAGRYAFIAVSDTGTGISNEAMPHLFEPFYTTKEAGSGTGLGLAAVHGVVLQHDGAIRVASDSGSGTTFTIYIPTTEPVGGTRRRISTSSMAIGGTEHVLVVEDDSLVREVTLRNLVELGYTVIGAGSAEEAIPLVGQADVVLSDVRLPSMAGTALAEHIAKTWPGKPVVLMSGLVEDDTQKAVIESGQFIFLSKPFTLGGMARCLRQALVEESS